ncbi:PepSY-associated TM helix domain-containing protein [Flavivirga aquimarina]|uniref:PepSY-associated TM helix domain-containing protein n=1 Tax=Flavivirga aquimarina TaxID=2027862 RepID=A0ABT8W566_9FLAO|nr:PepSY-associated TM helix domain-containing protein [Flavivirga aquimarina]MDO5968258.1 PepSY-associated TM helix domain-containing protein [Flavivirga aquimarina]
MKQNKRDYNVFFNVHTISGIVISVGLFVIFFAGAFALFMDEINQWQHNETKTIVFTPKIDYDRILEITKKEGFDLKGRESITINYSRSNANYISVNSSPIKTQKDIKQAFNAKDSLAKAKIYLKIDPKIYNVIARKRIVQGNLGSFLYYLHYFKQIPLIGRYIAGLVSLFFAVAIFSGIIIHWKKIISNFFTFRIKNSIKNLWTDAHAALGVLGIPFQLMYAITGVYFGLLSLLYLPSFFIVFDGDFDKTTELILPPKTAIVEVQQTNPKIQINTLIDNTLADVNKNDLNRVFVEIKKFEEPDASMSVDLLHNGANKFAASTRSLFRLSDGKKIYQKLLYDDYYNATSKTIRKLHYAEYGGYVTKIIYFILSMITCFVIISGVLIWLEARANKKYISKAKFNTNVGAIYMGVCMGLYPSIALLFCLVKVFPSSTKGEFGILSNVFFLFWLVLIIYAFFQKNIHKITKHFLLLAGIFGILIPILNGVQSGSWFWKAIQNNHTSTFFIDVCWLITGIITLLISFKMKPLKKAITKLQ